MIISDKLYSKLQSAPQTPGVYIWKDAGRNVLYIGKAINLKKRLLYYARDEGEVIAKTEQFLKQAESLEWIEVRNDVEAILLEMNLIRTLKPKYNAMSKDDKRPLLVHITNDEMPKVKTARQEIPGTGEYIGPFPDGGKLRSIMKKVRRIFPYCTCSNNRKKPCLYVDLGLCPSVPSIQNLEHTSEEYRDQKRMYKHNIARLKMFLRGNIDKVVKELNTEMKEFSEKMNYEKAAEVKIQIDAIEEILTQNANISSYLTDQAISPYLRKTQGKQLAQFLGLPFIRRIEGYDIANTSGTNPTASMVVFENGLPNTSEYRKFKITEIEGPNDPAMIGHALERRLRHEEWTMPDLILIDGGKSQVRAAIKSVADANMAIPVIGLAKRLEQIVIPMSTTKNAKGRISIKWNVVNLPLDTPFLVLLRAVRDESHRFGTTYHKKLRQKAMLEG